MGHARLWQGDSVLEADSIELLRDAKTLNASGNVRAVFPQSPGTGITPARALTVHDRAPNKVKLWHITAGTLTYNDAENRAHLGKDVVAQSSEQGIRAPQMDLYFTRSEKAPTAPGGAAASATAGAQQISRAVATGGGGGGEGSKGGNTERGGEKAPVGKIGFNGGENPPIYQKKGG